VKTIALRAIDALRYAGKTACAIGAGIAFAYFAVLAYAEDAITQGQEEP